MPRVVEWEGLRVERVDDLCFANGAVKTPKGPIPMQYSCPGVRVTIKAGEPAAINLSPEQAIALARALDRMVADG